MPDTPTASLIVIGNEILSGRTRDANIQFLASALGKIGAPLVEVRVIPDIEKEIVTAVNALRSKFTYVFTTGGIGPTHDDITAEAIARAFGVALGEHPEAIARLARHYVDSEFTPARRRMANVPDGGILIDNPVSAAPGFQMENVFVLAGVPKIMQAMFEGLRHRLVGGAPLLARTIRTNIPEGRIAARLGELQSAFPDIEIGSYPHMNARGPSVRLVLRATEAAHLAEAVTQLAEILTALGGTVTEVDISDG